MYARCNKLPYEHGIPIKVASGDPVREKYRRSGGVVRSSPPPLGCPEGGKFPSSGVVPEGRGGNADFVAMLQSVCHPEPRRPTAGHAESYAT